MAWIPQNEVLVIIRVIIAALLGLAIGLQREKRKIVHREYGAAGLRTHSLVSLGAALLTAVSVIYFSADPARLAASIMTGIGFIGAGTILATQEKIRGLTTAATIWAAAALGIASGVGYYASSIVATILIIFVLELHRFEKLD
jgi:putative Mg2+ transporter-C (MgtC) family protein